jgi:hypothetical protein
MRKRSIHGVIGPPKPKPQQPQQHSFATASPYAMQDAHTMNAYGYPQQPGYDEQDVNLPSFTANDQGAQDDLYEQFGLEIQRALSAPPAMELKQGNIFSFQSKYSHLFGDIRLEDDYAEFYNSVQDPSKLPPPIEQSLTSMWNYPITEKQFESKEGAFHGNGQLSSQMAQHNFYDMSTDMNNLSLNNQATNGADHRNLVHDLEAAAANLTSETAWPVRSPQPTVSPNQRPQVSPLQKPSQPQGGATKPAAVQQPSAQKPLSYSTVAAAATVATPAPAPAPVVVAPPAPSPTNSTTSSDDGKDGKKAKYTNISEVIGKIYSMAKDQHGCRFLQRKLEEGNTDDLDAIFSEVYNHIVELMTDPFGNYLCQKLLEHCNDKQKSAIISTVASSIVKISMNMHGTRAVQKLIECLNTPQHIHKVIDALRNAVVPLIKDLNGNHVIQRCLQKLSHNDKQFIYDAVAGRCVEVATHKHGCCVLQRCIDFASEDQKMQLIREVTNHALELVQNPFGNYVVQYVLDLGIDDVNSQVIAKFYGSLSSLATNKFSSNVIEKCLRISNIKVRGNMVAELSDSKTLEHLIQDSFGNYVVQTALSVSDAKQFTTMSDLIKPLLPLVRNTPYAKKIESKLNKKVPLAAPRPSAGAGRGFKPKK